MGENINESAPAAVEDEPLRTGTIAEELWAKLGDPGTAEIEIPAFRPAADESIAESGKAYLARVRDSLCAAHERWLPARPIEQAFARALDNVLDAIFEGALEEAAARRKTAPRIAMIATGGYGRGELAPFSDVDILFVHDSRSAGSTKKVAEQVLYVLWDLALDVGHAVRTIPECVKFAGEDDTIRTAMLDARLLRGDAKLWEEFTREVLEKAVLRDPDKYVEVKLGETRRRHEQYGSSVYRLEPNVKEGPGGLRDFQTVLWIGKIKFRVKDVRGLHQLGFLSRKELSEFHRYYDFLLRVRHELHFQANQKADRLSFDLQSKVPPGMGFPDSEPTSVAAERFMRRYYLVTRAGQGLTTIVLERMRQYGRTRPRLTRFFRRPRKVAEVYQLAGGELSPLVDDLFEREPWRMMEIFEKAQELDADLTSRTRELLYMNRYNAADAFLKDERAHESFRRIISRDRRIFRTLWEMHDLRLLTKYMPEFRTITCHVQHDAYHRYTTDIHTLFVVRECRRIMAGILSDELPLATELGKEVERKHVLYLSCMFHDIGKNMGGNHSDRGAIRAREICRRIGLFDEDVADVEWLVRDHLGLSQLALKRDLNDPRTISAFASRVRTVERLELLYLLTVSDMRATGPEVWTPWKGQLIDEAFRVTRYALEHGRIAPEDLEEMATQRGHEVVRLLSAEYPEELIREQLGLFPPRYFLVNSPGKIARHTRMILSHGIVGGDGEHLRKDFRAEPVWLEHETIPNTPYFEVTVYSLDQPRFFANVAGVFAGHGLSILSADITTLRDGSVVDVFHVSDPFERFTYEEDRWERVRKDLAEVLGGKRKAADLVAQTTMPVGLARFVARYPTGISFDNMSSRKYTIIDLTTGDRIGLLYTITNALSDLGLVIHLAKVSTKKERADDTFYVTDIFGQKIREDGKLRRIEEALRRALGVEQQVKLSEGERLLQSP